MQNKLTCNQVIALMSFYVEDKLNSRLKECIDEHLRRCPKCREAYMQSKKIVNHILNLIKEDETNPYQTKQYEDFKNNVSAYIDNELNENESIRIKKITITNPLARKDLEELYTFKRMLHNSFDKTKNELKNDYSKIIIGQLDKQSVEKDSLLKIIGVFTSVITTIVIGFLVLLYS